MSYIQKVLLIVNPCSGKSRKRVSAQTIAGMFPTGRYRVTLRLTERAGHAAELVRQYAGEHDLVVCAGGDGTLNETINGVMDMAHRIPVGYIPMGSTNDFATTLGIPSDVREAVDIITSGHKNWYDIGLFNNRYFQYVASFGAFTSASYSTPQRLKNIFGHSAYILTGMFQWKDLKPTPMKIEYDDVVIEDDIYFGAISNSTSVAGMFKFDPNTVRLDDGVFEVLLVRKLKSLLEVPILYKKVRHKEYDGQQIIFARTNNVKITCQNAIPWTLDGEFGGEHRQTVVSNLCRSIKICSPVNPLFQSNDADDDEETAENVEKTEKQPRFPKKPKPQAASADAEGEAEAVIVTQPT